MPTVELIDRSNPVSHFCPNCGSDLR
ncbi:DUF1610 domain-containing protein [Rhodococcus erythropolis]|nr:DUF1610 domain-containing protein [Rhodococcus erythropolis]